ncbi:hypothetical protein BC943DRAFT_347176 [Umbelopsis sp. AD052]|nr:hypothetical protein BC943DRAFT_347176 [Umbelopsis sp. AD052]
MSTNSVPPQPTTQAGSPAESAVTAGHQMESVSDADPNSIPPTTSPAPAEMQEEIKENETPVVEAQALPDSEQQESAPAFNDLPNGSHHTEPTEAEPQVPDSGNLPSIDPPSESSPVAMTEDVNEDTDGGAQPMDTDPQVPTEEVHSHPYTPTQDVATWQPKQEEIPEVLPQDTSVAKSSFQTSEQSSSSQSSGTYRPLNVRDALTYLDQVKVQFSDQPDVYNKFLDIMKDFKSQAIDTPGVIERVSTLFRGHPTLISGFNTFLPPGYRIECSLDINDQDVIKVTTPTGTTTTKGGALLQLSREGQTSNESPSYYGNTYEPATHPTSISHHGMPQYHEEAGPHPGPGPQDQLPPDNRRAPVEFNHAINYVNKIKNRFGNDPETYKQFLEILQTYQKEQKPIQEVYAQVQILFKDATDLLGEFKQFLPEVTGQPASSFFFDDPASVRGGKKGVLIGRKKRNTLENGADVAKGVKRSKQHHKTDYSEISSARDESFGIIEPKQPSMSAQETEFFERVKKHINNKSTYNEFLKVLNLFSQQIVDQNTLVERVQSFIGNDKKLFKWFKGFVGYNGKDEIVENIPATASKPDYVQSKSYGQSYRLIPNSLQNEACSGRDALCREVLNDEFVSHPTWSSEDSGFVSSKKNQYEEALHRCEEERYDYDLNIEANLNTIALLDPIAKKISIMANEEKAEFKLPLGLGGPSKTIYQRIIKKIYGHERGLEIIELLHENPAQVVPIVLKRLRQKDEEWKRAQREWNKIWREVDAKNYYKALDYLGINFKALDRKSITSKALITEAETLKREQSEQMLRSKSIPSIKPSGLFHHQFRYNFPDKALFSDVTRLIFSYLDRQTGISNSDCNKIREFSTSFVSHFFDVENVNPDLNKKAVVEDEDEAMADEKDSQSVISDDSDASTPGRGSSRRRQNHNRKSNSKGLLKDATRRRRHAGRTQSPDTTEKEATEDEADVKAEEEEEEEEDSTDVQMEEAQVAPTEPMEKAKSEPQADPVPNAQEETSEDQVLNAAAAATAPVVEQLKVLSIFGNNPFYCFLRLYQLAYQRLGSMKKIDAEFKANPEKAKKENRAAVELGVSSARLESVDLDFSQGYYETLLDLIDKFFEGDVDQQSFEECSRYIFGTKAYLVFTIDKLVHILAKQIHTLVTDDISIALLSGDRLFDLATTKSVYDYNKYAEELVGKDENIYQANFDANKRILTIQLLGKDDMNDDTNAEDRYESYVASYMDWIKDTEGVDHNRLRQPYMKRNLRPNVKLEQLSKAFVQSGMQYKICRNTYHMFYIIGSEDVFVRPHKTSLKTDSIKRTEKFQAWLESPMGWARDLSDDDKASKQAEAEALFKSSEEQTEEAGK